MEVVGSNFNVVYDSSRSAVVFKGSLRLDANGYRDIESLLQVYLAEAREEIVLDFTDLEFLNSSGINVVYKVAVLLRGKPSRLVVLGSTRHPWQAKTLPNFTKFKPDAAVRID
jgi:anti-anti-sigma factor